MFNKIFFLISFILISGCSSFSNPWTKFSTPTESKTSDSIGQYTAGCLAGAKSLTPDGAGYQMMRLSRGRFYGSEKLIEFIELIGNKVKKRNLGVLLIGDLSMARGGPMPQGHASHQNGLDVDIWYYYPLEAQKRSLRLDEREILSAKLMVDKTDMIIDEGMWNSRNESILKLVAERPEVERIFVNPAIKLKLCEKYQFDQSNWLSKVRPWWGHDYHYHVRLSCPKEGFLCKKQNNTPLTSGCDKTLEWWFSEEAKEKLEENIESAKGAKPKLPQLPQLCQKLLEL